MSSVDATPVWPIESKVKAATGGAGIGVVLGQLLDWLADQYVITPGHLDGNPVPVTLAIMVLAASAVAYIGGYLARHNVRPVDAINTPARPVSVPLEPVPAVLAPADTPEPVTAPVEVSVPGFTPYTPAAPGA